MTVGIDLGTTHSLVACYEAGMPMVLADDAGNRMTPSVVFYPEEGEPVAGHFALRQAYLYPERTIRSVKRLVGRSWNEVSFQGHEVPVFRGVDGVPRFQTGGRSPSAVEVSSEILRRLRKVAAFRLGRDIDRAVITVPAYFNDAQRTATRDAGQMAGLEVARILSEPTAAALAWGMDQLHDASRLAVFDLGGGTFDLSVLELKNGVFEVLATHGDTRLGGDDIDSLLVEWIARQAGLGPLHGELAVRVFEEARRAKHALSSDFSVEIHLPFAVQSSGRTLEINRETLEKLSQPVLKRIAPLCRRALHDARVQPRELDRVLLVGGATRMPSIRALARDIFSREPDVSQNPDEAIALGASIQAAILDGTVGSITLLDVTPLSLGIETFGGLMNVIIPRNSTIPCKAGEMFTNAADNQTEMRLSILQGERELAADNWKLGQIDVPFTPLPRGQARVGVQFEIDANGILTVLARDTASGRDLTLRVDRAAVEVEDARVEQMLDQSVEHAFEDRSKRLLVETGQKARELLAAVAVAYSQLGDDLPAGERVAIDSLVVETKQALESNSLAPLQAAVKRLDEFTEPLAARVLEKLMG